jgi:hypothetical protein
MESQRYHQQLSPLGLAIAAGATALILSLLVGLPMMGIGGIGGGMMGGYGRGMMWGGYAQPFVGFDVMWIVCALIAALAGAILAWIYNAVNVASSRNVQAQKPQK